MPIYEEKEKVDGKKRYFIRTYVVDKFGKKRQITKHNKEWVGQNGKFLAQQEELRIKNSKKIDEVIRKNITLRDLKLKYLGYIKNSVDQDTLKVKETKLNHFCEIDTTNQVTTFPDEYVRNFDKETYIKWEAQMKNKKYSQNKYSKIKKNYSIKHLNTIHSEIVNMLDFAIIEGYCEINFAKQAGKMGTPKEIKLSKMDKKYNVINYEEYLRLLNATKDDSKYNTLFDLGFSRGVRPGEMRALRIVDYNYEKKQIMINHTLSKKNKLKDPKTASSKATVDLDDNLNEKINNLINSYKQNSSFNDKWFIFNGATPLSSHAIDNAKSKYFKLANIEQHLRIHDFRHSCATWLCSIGVPITVISKILRHSSIKETMKTYTHLFNEDYQNNLVFIDKYKQNHIN